MKKLFLICLIIFQACNHRLPLKGNYPETAQSVIINKSEADLWNKISDFIVEKGFSLSLLDKTTGLVLADFKFLNEHASFELKNGNLYNPAAFIAADRWSYDYPNDSRKYEIGGMWNLRLLAVTDSTTLVRAKLHSISVSGDGLIGKSTGYFEKWILDELATK